MLPPFYYKDVSDDGLFAYFSEVIQKVGSAALQIYIYNIPPVTKINLSLSLLERLTKEYPKNNGEPYYPVNDQTNNNRYNEYKKFMVNETKYLFGGRLADYKYYDMHQVIGSALKRVKDEINLF